MGIDVSKIRVELEEQRQNLPTEISDTVEDVLQKLNQVQQGGILEIREQMDAAYRARTLTRLAISAVEVDGDKLLQIANDSLTNVETLGIDPSLIQNLAKMIFAGQKIKPGEAVIIAGAKRNIEVLEEIARLCLANGIDFIIDIASDETNQILINNASDEGLQALGEERSRHYAPAKTLLAAHSNPYLEFEPERNQIYQSAQKELSSRISDEDLRFSFTVLPTEKDAEIDGIPYQKYLRLFLESCDQPWAAIEKAQAKLIEKLNQGKSLKITNKDGTNLDFEIDGFTFINSTTEENIPGSEVFSAPGKTKVNGTLKTKGAFKYKTFPIIKNITLEFKDGKVVDFDASEGKDTLEMILSTDDGAKFVGEIAFGTNPHLRRHLVNALLVEKIGGSFHLALGSSHQRSEHKGQAVNVDNGNRSKIHWDITTLLKNGEVMLDGQTIQKNGIWVDESGAPDPDLAVLNYGWDAIMPKENRPPWWKERYPRGYED
ncbi:aminopeptidase [Candidatus Peregrinibacteria bacterium]|jgi:aminopeptidase|nr:aminopeptidase [Candidatus Peregrinibacteria bacterium]MBT7736937.1 aminopeptidase [Candidatus Peregrinibacteria bacterium]